MRVRIPVCNAIFLGSRGLVYRFARRHITQVAVMSKRKWTGDSRSRNKQPCGCERHLGALVHYKVRLRCQEREERKLFEKERQEQRRKAEAVAAVERREREKEREALAQEERRRREAEAHDRELTEHREWVLMFLESRKNAEATVGEFICKARSKKIWPVKDISREYGVSSEEVEVRLRQLLADDRMFGVVSNGNFIFLEPDDMKSIAESIKRNGRTSLSELGREICRVATGSSNNDSA